MFVIHYSIVCHSIILYHSSLHYIITILYYVAQAAGLGARRRVRQLGGAQADDAAPRDAALLLNTYY